MNNEPVYGNHIGVVVSNEDPEGRNRVQVFVPYVSTTLFDDWNAKQVDIEIGPGTFDKIDAKILARLKLNLPWAEAALPMFGGNGSVSYNKNQEPTVTRAPVTSENPPARGVVNLNKSGEPVISVSSATITTGATTGATSSTPSFNITTYGNYGGKNGENNGDINSLMGIGGSIEGGKGQMLLRTGDVAMRTDSKIYQDISNAIGKNLKRGDIVEINGQQIRYADSGSTLLKTENRIDFYKTPSNGAEVNNLIKSIQNSSIDSSTVKYVGTEITPTPPELTSWINEATKINPTTGESAFQSVARENGLKPDGYGGYSFPSGANIDWAPILAKTNQRMGDRGNANILAKYGPSGSNANIASATSDTTKPEATKFGPLNIDPSVPIAQGAYNNITTPGGVHSKPQIGTMVWVFFYGGDTMRPVYFAGVSEPQSIGRSAG